MTKHELTRRAFLAAATTSAAGLAFAQKPNTARVVPRKISPNEKVNVAAIGAGGKGREDVFNCRRENIVARIRRGRRRPSHSTARHRSVLPRRWAASMNRRNAERKTRSPTIAAAGRRGFALNTNQQPSFSLAALQHTASQIGAIVFPWSPYSPRTASMSSTRSMTMTMSSSPKA